MRDPLCLAGLAPGEKRLEKDPTRLGEPWRSSLGVRAMIVGRVPYRPSMLPLPSGISRSREINCLVTGSGGKLLLSTTVTQMGQMKIDQDRIVFREGTVTAEPDGSFVIGEFRPETGAPLPIKVCLEKVSNATTPNQKP
jgi:hypothetical protein